MCALESKTDICRLIFLRTACIDNSIIITIYPAVPYTGEAV